MRHPRLVPQRLLQGLSQRQTDILEGVVLIDMVMWKCGNCGTYMGFLPWP